MRICIYGAGAIGGYMAAKLAQAGTRVSLVARGPHLARMQSHGLTLIEDGQQVTVPVTASDSPAQLGPQDYLIVTLKAHSVPPLVAAMQPLIGPQTTVVSCVNGVPWWYFHKLAGPYEGRAVTSVDPEGAIAAAIEPERVIGSVVYPAAELVEPGVVKVIEGNRFTLGEPDGTRSERIETLSHALMRAGFKAPVAKDIRAEIWVKLWGNVSFNPLSALTHATLEDICRFPPTRQLAAVMMGEAQRVAEALGVRFKITLEQRLAGAEAVGAHKTSMLLDVEHGRALELEALVGAVVELGRITAVPTPTIEAIYATTTLLGRTLAAQRARLRPEPLPD